MTTNRPAIRPPNTIITHHRSPRTAQGAYATRRPPGRARPARARHMQRPSRQRPQTAARCAPSIAERRNRLSWPGFPPGGSRFANTHMPSRHSAHSSSPRTPRPARRMGWVAATPAVRAGFDGPPPTLPAPQVPRRAGESTALARTPLTRRSCQGSVLRHPAPSNTPRHGEGGCSIGGGPLLTKLALRQDSPVADLSEGFGWRPSRRANARSLSPFRWLRKGRESLQPRARSHTYSDVVEYAS